jgi:hypothetical protein
MGKRKQKTRACNPLRGFPETPSQQAARLRDRSVSGYFRVQAIVLSEERCAECLGRHSWLKPRWQFCRTATPYPGHLNAIDVDLRMSCAVDTWMGLLEVLGSC